MSGIDAERFSSELARLKREGCAVLAVGEASRTARRRICQRLLGDDTAARRRILVSTASRQAVPLHGDIAPDEHTTIIRRQVRTRNATVTGSRQPSPVATVTIGDPDLDVLGRSIVLAIDEFTSTDLDSAVLRLCIDAGEPLLETNSVHEVETFVSGIFERVVATQGMGHAHLRVGMDHDAVDVLRQAFDVLVEVRPGSPAEQRWHIDDADLVSAWLPVESPDEPT